MVSSPLDAAAPASDLAIDALHRRLAPSDTQLASSPTGATAAWGAPATPSLRFGHGDRPQPCAPLPPTVGELGVADAAGHGRRLPASLGDIAARLEPKTAWEQQVCAEVMADFAARATIPRAAQAEAVARLVAHLDASAPPVGPPWVVAQMDANLLICTNWLRHQMMQRQHARLTLHISDEGYLGYLCGRWHWRRSTGWRRQAWTAQEAAAGGVVAACAQVPGLPEQMQALGQRRFLPSLALQSLMATIASDAPAHLAGVRLNICCSSHQLAALIAERRLPAPMAVLATNIALGEVPAPDSSNSSGLLGRDDIGPYLLTCRLLDRPEVARPRPRAATDALDEAQMLGQLADGRPLSALAATFDPQLAAQMRWLDLAALRAADLQLACAPAVPVFVCRGERGERLNRQALAALCARQVGEALALAQAGDADA